MVSITVYLYNPPKSPRLLAETCAIWKALTFPHYCHPAPRGVCVWENWNCVPWCLTGQTLKDDSFCLERTRPWRTISCLPYQYHEWNRTSAIILILPMPTGGAVMWPHESPRSSLLWLLFPIGKEPLTVPHPSVCRKTQTYSVPPSDISQTPAVCPGSGVFWK